MSIGQDSPEAREQELYDRLRAYDNAHMTFLQVGLLVKEVDEKLLHRLRLDDRDKPMSLNRWIRTAAPKSYGTCYQAWNAVKLMPDVPPDELAEIPHESVQTLISLSGGVRKLPDVLAAARQGNDALVAHVQRTQPNQHVSSVSSFRLKPTTEQKAEIEEACEIAIRNGDAANREEAIYMWAVGYKLEHQAEYPTPRGASARIQ